jgi:alanyl-tRNA synthetase
LNLVQLTDMDARTIRKKYLEFFKQRGHVIVPRANLVPQEDATTLFTGSGMQPMVPYLLGATHPEGKRIADSQTCLRAEDIEEVGDNRHTTFFEMLGNWSLGDYFKQEQLPWLFEFLTDVIGLDPNKLYVTCFSGAPEYDLPKDDESAQIWEKLFAAKGIKAKSVMIGSETQGYQKGMQGGRIFYYDARKNWWSRGGPPETTPVGDPCGPDSEVFYDFGTPHDKAGGEHCHPNCDCGRFFEIANSVFMAYKRTDSGFEPLAKPNVDFGGGLERLAAAAIADSDMFKISLLWPIIQKLEELSQKQYEQHKAAMQVIADHLRAAMWLAVDGVVPSNTQQGYVMRRLMRRAIRYGLELGIAQDFSAQVAPTVIKLYQADFPEVAERKDAIMDTFTREERVFRQTLKKGVNEFRKMTRDGRLRGDDVFKLYDTYGFPTELTLEEAAVNNVELDKDWHEQFERLMEEQKERSRTATTGQFKGGLGGESEMHKKYHTATHLVYKALRLVLGDHVIQRGSNITEERLRFDFSHPQKVTPEEIAEVERIVNENIKKDWPMGFTEMSPDEAFKQGALGAFGDKYGAHVKVYTAGDPEGDWFSKEICGGPHVDHTGELAVDSTGSPSSKGNKTFKITKEEASSAGVRRIKAVLQ